MSSDVRRMRSLRLLLTRHSSYDLGFEEHAVASRAALTSSGCKRPGRGRWGHQKHIRQERNQNRNLACSERERNGTEGEQGREQEGGNGEEERDPHAKDEGRKDEAQVRGRET